LEVHDIVGRNLLWSRHFPEDRPGNFVNSETNKPGACRAAESATQTGYVIEAECTTNHSRPAGRQKIGQRFNAGFP